MSNNSGRNKLKRESAEIISLLFDHGATQDQEEPTTSSFRELEGEENNLSLLEETKLKTQHRVVSKSNVIPKDPFKNCDDDDMGFSSRMDCCGQFVKNSLFISNIIIFVGGATVFCLSLWTLVDRSFINEFLGTNLFSGAVYVLLVNSVAICLLSFLGCAGAGKGVKYLLLTYFIIVALVFVIMLIGGIFCYVFRERVQQTMGQEMRSSMALYGSRRDVTQGWDQTQGRLQCCGVDTWIEWTRFGSIPESCCQEIFGGQRKECTIFPTITNLYTQGCLYVASTYIRDHAAIIGGTSIAVAIIMICGMGFSCLLFNMIK